MSALTEPITLRGRHAALEPLAYDHHDQLVEACATANCGSSGTRVPSPEGMRAEIERRLGLQQAGSMLPFAARSLASRQDRRDDDVHERRREKPPRRNRFHLVRQVGASARRSNTECKLLLLTHAFETLDCIAVEFRTGFFNHASRRAIERLGAKQDGILRSHQHYADGSLRDTVVFSIIASEWPAVKHHLQFKLAGAETRCRLCCRWRRRSRPC